MTLATVPKVISLDMVESAGKAWLEARRGVERALQNWASNQPVWDSDGPVVHSEPPGVHLSRAEAESKWFEYLDLQRRYDAQERATEVAASLSLGRANKWVAVVVGGFAAIQALAAFVQILTGK